MNDDELAEHYAIPANRRIVGKPQRRKNPQPEESVEDSGKEEGKPKLDFSMFHPLDHRIGDARCRAHYGGWRRHLELNWLYGEGITSRYGLEHPFYSLLLCRLGKHKLETWHRHADNTYFTACKHCDYDRDATKEEEFEVPEY